MLDYRTNGSSAAQGRGHARSRRTARASAPGRQLRVGIVAAAALMGAGCGSSAVASHAGTSSPTATAIAPSTATPATCQDISIALPPASGTTSADPVVVLANGINKPDDLYGAASQLYLGAYAAGQLDLLPSWAPPLASLPNSLGETEGMTEIDGVMYVAEQGLDRVVRLGPGATETTVLQLHPVAGQQGVDGIGSVGGTLLIPDSPHGVVYWVSTAGAIIRSVPGFVRPTDAWGLSDGTVLVADEDAGSVTAVAPDGSKTILAHGWQEIDDIVTDSSGNVFGVTENNPIGEVTEESHGVETVVVHGLQGGQGIASGAADDLAVTEENAGRVDMVVQTFLLEPVVLPEPGGLYCLSLLRQSSFTAPITLSGSSGVRVLHQPGSGDIAEINVARCTSSCTVTARSGSLSQTVPLQ